MTTKQVGNWTRVCDAAVVRPGEAQTLDVDPPVSVWNVDGEFYATDDTCTHEKFSLAESYIDGCQVECALHWAKFDVRTGEALGLPATGALNTYPVLVEDGSVFVDLSSRNAA
jgi:3-phenylpropionate/trans-cinnamate dioxygenase ferredoxin subunit